MNKERMKIIMKMIKKDKCEYEEEMDEVESETEEHIGKEMEEEDENDSRTAETGSTRATEEISVTNDVYTESDDDVEILNVDIPENIRRVRVITSVIAEEVYTYRGDELIHIEQHVTNDSWSYTEQ
jgi:hypothetical protein